MAKKPEKPFHKIMTTRSKLQMWVQYGDQALGEQTAHDFAGDLLECFEHLITFRNIINGMVGFDEPPEDAALFYISTDKIIAAAEQSA